jgi:hypothetical protein
MGSVTNLSAAKRFNKAQVNSRRILILVAGIVVSDVLASCLLKRGWKRFTENEGEAIVHRITLLYFTKYRPC